MRSYVTLSGRVLDLSQLSKEERTFLTLCAEAYRDGADWIALRAFLHGKENPLLHATDGWVTREVWEHPLYRAVRDMEHRLAIRQGELLPDAGDQPEREPFVAESRAVAARVGARS